MTRRQQQTATAVACVAIFVAAIWGYARFGGVIASSDGPGEKSSGTFYRVVVRRTLISRIFSDSEFEAELLLRGNKPISTQAFRWDSWSADEARIEWINGSEFLIIFRSHGQEGETVRCRIFGFHGTWWNYRGGV